MVSRIEGLVSDLASRRLRLGYNDNEGKDTISKIFCSARNHKTTRVQCKIVGLV